MHSRIFEIVQVQNETFLMIFKQRHLLYEKDKSAWNKRRVVGGEEAIEQDLWGSVSVLSR